jgi:hypothetical protein
VQCQSRSNIKHVLWHCVERNKELEFWKPLAKIVFLSLQKIVHEEWIKFTVIIFDCPTFISAILLSASCGAIFCLWSSIFPIQLSSRIYMRTG